MISILDAGIAAVRISEELNPKLTAQEQALFVAGFQECIKWLNMEKDSRSCPCLYLDEPCDQRCTCINGFSSFGCKYCSTYGSLEQRKARAEFIADAIKNFIKK